MNDLKPRNFIKKDKKFKLEELNNFVGMNKKGVYYIEDNLLKNKFSRYFMFLRLKNVDMNKLFDMFNEHDKINNSNE